MRALWRIALGPVLLWQGAGVRRNILRMPEPDGPRSGGEGSLRLLILGDSSAAGVGVADQADALSGRLVAALDPESVAWRVLARTGWTTADALAALSAEPAESFDAAVICLGVNDVTTESGVKPWLAAYARLLDRLRDRHGVRRTYLCGLPPMGRFPALPQPLRWYMGLQSGVHDAALAAFARDREGVQHLPVDGNLPDGAVAEDGFHPGPLVYAELGRRFARAIIADREAGHLRQPASRTGRADS